MPGSVGGGHLGSGGAPLHHEEGSLAMEVVVGIGAGVRYGCHPGAGGVARRDVGHDIAKVLGPRREVVGADVFLPAQLVALRPESRISPDRACG